ncbi:hypothetical protein TURU_025304 [Turdus rufiventris]|nr:hypothetical protein TURU_025304 [Turdus rufiventris]
MGSGRALESPERALGQIWADVWGWIHPSTGQEEGNPPESSRELLGQQEMGNHLEYPHLGEQESGNHLGYPQSGGKMDQRTLDRARTGWILRLDLKSVLEESWTTENPCPCP